MPHEIDVVAKICAHHNHDPAALLEILHDTQERFGCVSDDATRQIAEHLNLSRADIHGVRSFYNDFTRQDDKPRLKLCRAEACQAVGSERLAAQLEDRGIRTETIFCLGNCALGPAAMIGDRLIGRASADLLAAELADD
ncbi:MAG: NAD(P)H-dependent oxidoreductase subunit E [Pseudomonadota bacterium]|nr:NAD(P)H-dependent oxidoreductase subunit E [Pseudomonadota bacterium]